MAELEIAPLPPVEPEAPQLPAGPKGTAAFVAEMDSMISGETPEASEEVKEDKSKATPKPAREAEKAPKAAERPVPPPATPQPEREERDPVKLRLAHKALKQEYESFKGSKTKELQSLGEKLAVLEKKRTWTEDDNNRSQALEKRAKDLEAELFSRDYKESPEFKDKFATKWDKTWKNAVADVRGMQVKYIDGDEEKMRPATEHDFERIRALGGTRSEQRKMAKELFGEDAGAVIEYAAQLKGIEEQAAEEIATKRKSFDDERQKHAENYRRYGQTYETARQEVDRALEEKYPQFFGENTDDPEGTAAFKKGLDFVDETLRVADQIPVEDRAARNAIIRRWAAAFPRMAVQVKRLQADLAARDEELGKYRKSDPGSGGEGQGEQDRGNAPKTTADLAREFDTMK